MSHSPKPPALIVAGCGGGSLPGGNLLSAPGRRESRHGPFLPRSATRWRPPASLRPQDPPGGARRKLLAQKRLCFRRQTSGDRQYRLQFFEQFHRGDRVVDHHSAKTAGHPPQNTAFGRNECMGNQPRCLKSGCQQRLFVNVTWNSAPTRRHRRSDLVTSALQYRYPDPPPPSHSRKRNRVSGTATTHGRKASCLDFTKRSSHSQFREVGNGLAIKIFLTSDYEPTFLIEWSSIVVARQ
jgi:hypothetical protein